MLDSFLRIDFSALSGCVFDGSVTSVGAVDTLSWKSPECKLPDFEFLFAKHASSLPEVSSSDLADSLSSNLLGGLLSSWSCFPSFDLYLISASGFSASSDFRLETRLPYFARIRFTSSLSPSSMSEPLTLLLGSDDANESLSERTAADSPRNTGFTSDFCSVLYKPPKG